MADRNPNTHTEEVMKGKRCPIISGNCWVSECTQWKWATGSDPVKSKELIQSERKRTDQNIKNTEALKEAQEVKEAAVEKIKEDFLNFKGSTQPEGYCGLTR